MTQNKEYDYFANCVSYHGEMLPLERYTLYSWIKKYKPSYNLSELLDGGVIRLFTESTEKKKLMNIILKISGLWEDNETYGITYKFFSV